MMIEDKDEIFDPDGYSDWCRATSDVHYTQHQCYPATLLVHNHCYLVLVALYVTSSHYTHHREGWRRECSTGCKGGGGGSGSRGYL